MLRVTSNVKDVIRTLDRVQRRQVPFATALALTRTAKDVLKREQQEMRRVFKQPVRYTINSMFVQPATKRKLVASVEFKTSFGTSKGSPAIKYLRTQIRGGKRSFTRLEQRLKEANPVSGSYRYVVPGKGLKRTAAGNMSRGELVKILSQMKVLDRGNNITARSRRNKRAFYFQRDNVIYRRKRGSPDIVPVLVFVKSPTYRKRFAFKEVAVRHARKRFPIQFSNALQRALATARGTALPRAA